MASQGSHDPTQISSSVELKESKVGEYKSSPLAPKSAVSLFTSAGSASESKVKVKEKIRFSCTYDANYYRCLRVLLVLQDQAPISHEGSAVYYFHNGKKLKIGYRCDIPDSRYNGYERDDKPFKINLYLPACSAGDRDKAYIPSNGEFKETPSDFHQHFIAQINKLGIKCESNFSAEYGSTIITVNTNDPSMNLLVNSIPNESEEQRLFKAIPTELQFPAIEQHSIKAISQLATRIIQLALAQKGIKIGGLIAVDVINRSYGTERNNTDPVILGFSIRDNKRNKQRTPDVRTIALEEKRRCSELLMDLGLTHLHERIRFEGESLWMISNPHLFFKKGLEFQIQLALDMQKFALPPTSATPACVIL